MKSKEKEFHKGIMLLGVAVAFNISTIIFGMHNQMVITFEGITFDFIIECTITLLTKNNKN